MFTLPIIISLLKDPAARQLLRGRVIDADALRETLLRSHAIEESVEFAEGLLREAEASAGRLNSPLVSAWCLRATGQLRDELSCWRSPRA